MGNREWGMGNRLKSWGQGFMMSLSHSLCGNCYISGFPFAEAGSQEKSFSIFAIGLVFELH